MNVKVPVRAPAGELDEGMRELKMQQHRLALASTCPNGAHVTPFDPQRYPIHKVDDIALPGDAGGRIQVATRDTAIPADEDLLQDFTTASHSSSGGGSTCPFLAALPRPPPAQHKWWQRPKQLFDPVNFQPAALGPHRVVQAAAEMLLPGQIISECVPQQS